MSLAGPQQDEPAPPLQPSSTLPLTRLYPALAPPPASTSLVPTLSLKLPRSALLLPAPDFRAGMTSYQPAPILKPPPPAASQRTPESRHWRRYRQPTYIKAFAPITHVHFAPNRPHRLAVTAGAEVKLYAPRTNKVVKTVTRFKETARGGEVRRDGNLLVAGDDSGLVQVCRACQSVAVG